MTAQILNIRDYQQRRDLERLYNEAGNNCAIAASIALIPHDREIPQPAWTPLGDNMAYVYDKDVIVTWTDTAPSEMNCDSGDCA